MKLTKLARELCEEIAELTIIDAHEHFPSEATYLSFSYSGPNLFAGGYVQHDLRSAGAPEEVIDRLRDGGDRPVDAWWPHIRAQWEYVRRTSYARALLVTARDVFGISDINDETIGALAEAVKADNTPGIYRRNLQERCRIRYSICYSGPAAFPDDSGLRGITAFCRWHQPELLNGLQQLGGRDIATLDDATAVVQAALRQDIAAGAVGFKMMVEDFGPPNGRAAELDLRQARRASDEAGPLPALRDYLFDKCCDVAAEADLPVAVHTGYWGDFRSLDPKIMLGFALRRRDVRFDMFHLGAPMYRDAVLIGKNLPNVTLNLTWCPIISQVQTKRTLDEILDLVPLNKIIAFGGDYRVAVQKVYGHLVLAREVVAAALADRIEAGDLDRDAALHIAKLWFAENPARIYRLS
jgi:predicted TIM-barrel fold metal-dependent hydrolase